MGPCVSNAAMMRDDRVYDMIRLDECTKLIHIPMAKSIDEDAINNRINDIYADEKYHNIALELHELYSYCSVNLLFSVLDNLMSKFKHVLDPIIIFNIMNRWKIGELKINIKKLDTINTIVKNSRLEYNRSNIFSLCILHGIKFDLEVILLMARSYFNVNGEHINKLFVINLYMRANLVDSKSILEYMRGTIYDRYSGNSVYSTTFCKYVVQKLHIKQLILLEKLFSNIVELYGQQRVLPRLYMDIHPNTVSKLFNIGLLFIDAKNDKVFEARLNESKHRK